MSVRHRLGTAVLFGSALPAGVACGWAHLDAIGAAPAVADAEPLEAAMDTETSDGTDASAPLSIDAGISPDVQPVDATSDSGASDAAEEVETSSPDAGMSNDPCTRAQTPLRQWTFDTDTEGWLLSMDTGVQGSLAWTGTAGMPGPGALQIDVNPGSAMAHGAWARYLATPLGDLSGRTISAWLWLESGTSPHVKLYVQTGTQYTWADNGTVYLNSRTWTCVSMNVSSPLYTNGPNYDPSNVDRIGVELLGAPLSPFRVYVDSVRYY